ncbi:MAG: hypothetical protein J0L84_06520 [Verrucomicrobia bacterium]|nr:hypothetical protein [Verrucomicrobiota bacterium]
MNETERMLQQINELFRALGDQPIQLALQGPVPELDLLRAVKQEYRDRLFAKVPAYRAIPSEAAIPDLVLQSLRYHEAQLEGRSR